MDNNPIKNLFAVPDLRNRILFTRSRDFLLGPDASAQRRNYFIYPIVRVDGVDVPGVEWTFRYTDVAADTVASAR